MKAMYEARVEDLAAEDYLHVECACGHIERLTGAMLLTAGVAPYQKIKGIERRLRCRECDAKGKVIVSIKWADAPTR
jgi:hypothetical protein